MRLRDLLFPLHGRRRMARQATAIARQSLPQAAAAVGDRMFAMTLPEARGYVRARARLAVVAEIDGLLQAGQKMSFAASHQLVELALDQVVGRIIAQRLIEETVRFAVRRAA